VAIGAALAAGVAVAVTRGGGAGRACADDSRVGGGAVGRTLRFDQ
jgi:hypothetical protein